MLVTLVVVKVTSCVWLFATLWTVVCQTPLSIEFSRQEFWSGLLFPSSGDLPDPAIETLSCIAGRFFTIEPLPKNSTRSSLCIWNEIQNGKTLLDFAPSASPTIFVPGSVPTTLDFILFLKMLNLFFPRSLCTCCSLCQRLSPPLLVSAFSWSCLSSKVREAIDLFTFSSETCLPCSLL